jgi:predicted NBD/HSP70 family sugar kinase
MQTGFRIGIDIGGTKIDIVLIDSADEIIHHDQISTPNNYRLLLNKIESSIPAGYEANCIGLGIPGLLAPSGIIEEVTNIPYLNGMNLGQDIASLTQRKVSMANHLHCFALSEAIQRPIDQPGIIACLTLGTGIGMSLLIDNKVYVGSNSLAGEIGSSILIGKNNTMSLEDLMSGASIDKHKKSKLFSSNIMALFANIILFLDPTEIIVVGGLLKLKSGFLKNYKVELSKLLPRSIVRTRIRKSEFGELSVARGVALLTKDVNKYLNVNSPKVIHHFS